MGILEKFEGKSVHLIFLLTVFCVSSKRLQSPGFVAAPPFNFYSSL